MEREIALQRFETLIGEDLRPLADKYEVTVFAANGKKNKGWAGHVAERFLGLPKPWISPVPFSRCETVLWLIKSPAAAAISSCVISSC